MRCECFAKSYDEGKAPFKDLPMGGLMTSSRLWALIVKIKAHIDQINSVSYFGVTHILGPMTQFLKPTVSQ